ncbi:hypothetical protein AVEN_63172-1 [Araneus ventricosus]|uniref:Uncharacterized protein n=1 Tax=Araneus ventricosus TaxID=182803 RepID=A0A4Y2B0I1_ARAVE|nr:hypothetical protein AVEN_63172-1 [Araneus ventricosus]
MKLFLSLGAIIRARIHQGSKSVVTYRVTDNPLDQFRKKFFDGVVEDEDRYYFTGDAVAFDKNKTLFTIKHSIQTFIRPWWCRLSIHLNFKGSMTGKCCETSTYIQKTDVIIHNRSAIYNTKLFPQMERAKKKTLTLLLFSSGN